MKSRVKKRSAQLGVPEEELGASRRVALELRVHAERAALVTLVSEEAE